MIDQPTLNLSVDYSSADLIEGLRSIGIDRGDTIFFQACVETLGEPGDCATDEQLCEMLYASLREVVGAQGTILVPAYTFSFCRQQIFDVEQTPTVAGPWNTFAAFPEYVRRLPGAVRSADPIFSTAGVGPKAAELLTHLPHVCLGEDSVHDRIRRVGGKLCILGVGLYEAIFRHYAEAIAGVPWRYNKLFTGQVREYGALRKEGWIYNVRILASNADPAGEQLEAQARASEICRAARIGNGEILAADSQALFDLALSEFARDPWYSARGPAGDPVAIEEARIGERLRPIDLPDAASMRQMIDALWRLPRDIISNGYDTALQELATQLPMTIHEYPTGMECWTWLVPEKWICYEAYLETLDGRRLFSYHDCPLHVVSYSLPFEGEVSRAELLEHLHVHPRLPDAVPFIFKYYERDWGLCCSQELKQSLTEDRYRVVIKSSFSYGTLKVGEVLVPGQSDDCIVLCAHLCHPSMVNDDLSGVVVGMDVMRALLQRSDLRYSYRFLIVPETIGSVAYLSQNEALIPNFKGGLFLEMLGKTHPHALQQSFTGTAEVDRCFAMALKQHDPAGWIGAFRTIIGNDERQYNAPGVRVPMLSLSRVLQPSDPEYPYREYHSSHDTPEIISNDALAESRDLILRMIDTVEQNVIPVNRFKGEVFCARYGVHIDWYTNPEGHGALFNVMYLIDGTRSVAEIADTCGISFEAARLTIDELRRHGLVEYQ
jgi:aminopeptidase-like protein/aminoglycoside N3'-acetyltransferase